MMRGSRFVKTLFFFVFLVFPMVFDSISLGSFDLFGFVGFTKVFCFVLMGVKFYKVWTARIGWVVLVGVILLMGCSFTKCVNCIGVDIAIVLENV